MYIRRLSAAAASALSLMALFIPAASAAPTAAPTPTATATTSPIVVPTSSPTPSAPATAAATPTSSPTPTATATKSATTLDPKCDQLSMLCSGGPGGKPLATGTTATRVGSAASATDDWNYINRVAPWAVDTMKQYGVPASVTIAQSILESGWGQSGLTLQGNAFFGIKCSPNGYWSPWQNACLDFPTQEWDATIGWYTIHSYFRGYASAQNSFMDHGLFLVENSRYASAFGTNNADDFIREVARDGYATDPYYANSVIRIMQNYNLYMYDTPGWQLQAAYGQMGGNGSWLGNTTTGINCGLVRGGCWQGFEGGIGYWSPNSGAHFVRNAILARYGDFSYERSRLGYPTSEEVCGLRDGGCWQGFEFGVITWSPATGAQPSWGGIGQAYESVGYERSTLGYATGPETCGLKDGGCSQTYQGGRILWSPATASYVVWGEIGQRYVQLGAEKSRLGYPSGPEVCGLPDSGCYQSFQFGRTYWTSATHAFPVWGGIGQRYVQVGASSSLLGYPLAGEVCGLKDGGCSQTFQGGRILWSPNTASYEVWGAFGTRYAQLGYQGSRLGYPTAAETCGLRDGGCSQPFQGGVLYWSPKTDAFPVWGAIGDRYRQLGAQASRLGYPTGSETCGLKDGGCSQSFQGGRIFWSATTNAHEVWGAFATRYAQLGYQASRLGYPVGGEACGLKDGGCVQAFQGGWLFWAPGGDAYALWGAISSRYGQLGSQNSILGYPTSPEICGIKNNGCYQSFQRGAIYWSSSTGTWESAAPLRSAYVAQGSEKGKLGLPTSAMTSANGVTTQRYEGGTLNWTSTRGTWIS